VGREDFTAKAAHADRDGEGGSDEGGARRNGGGAISGRTAQ
jgi:hypothetical protein